MHMDIERNFEIVESSFESNFGLLETQLNETVLQMIYTSFAYNWLLICISSS